MTYGIMTAGSSYLDLKKGLCVISILIMVDLSDINRYAADIARIFNPERVVLFGSYAGGHPTEDSDVDLLVIMEHDGRDIEQAYAIRCAVPRTFPLDMVVRTPSKIRQRLKNQDPFLTSILQEGKTLYARGS